MESVKEPIEPTPEERRKAVEAAQRRLLAKGQPKERVGERWGRRDP